MSKVLFGGVAVKPIRLPVMIACLGIAVAAAAGGDWPVFRGNSAQQGISDEKLPDQLHQIWSVKTGDSIEGAAAIVEGVAYVASQDQYLYALDLTNGKERWKHKFSAPIKVSPAVRKGRVYVGDLDGNFVCLDAPTGKELWKFQADSEITSGANFAGEKVLFGSGDENLSCLDANGRKAWVFRVPGGPVMATPAVDKNVTFVSGCDSKMHFVDVNNGTEIAAIDVGGQTGATPALRDGVLYVGTMSNTVLAIDIAKKEVVWGYEATRGQPFYASAAVTEKLVIAGCRDKRVYALDRGKGTEVWSFATEGRIEGSPLVVGSRVYAGSMDEKLYVIDLNKGTELQNIKLDSAVTGSIAVSGGRLVVGTQNGTVYCFGPK
jgi:outer membrane protein assembly factor BamB